MHKLLGLSLALVAVAAVGFATGQLRGAPTGHAAGLSHSIAAVTNHTTVSAAARLSADNVVASASEARAASARIVTHTASISRSRAFSGGSGGSSTTKAYSSGKPCNHAGGASWGHRA